MAVARATDDCDVLLCRGMRWGAYGSMRQAGIEMIVTGIAEIEGAAQAHLDGIIVDRKGKPH